MVYIRPTPSPSSLTHKKTLLQTCLIPKTPFPLKYLSYIAANNNDLVTSLRYSSHIIILRFVEDFVARSMFVGGERERGMYTLEYRKDGWNYREWSSSFFFPRVDSLILCKVCFLSRARGAFGGETCTDIGFCEKSTKCSANASGVNFWGFDRLGLGDCFVFIYT